MNCDFAPTGRIDERGWREYRCRRIGCGFTATSPHAREQVIRQCDCVDLDAGDDGPHVAVSRGFGDTFARVLKAIGISKSHGCGCARRRRLLNRLVPYSTGMSRMPHGTARWRIDHSQRRRLLLVFPHGLGDAVQLTTVLLHLRDRHPEWEIDVAVRPGAESLFGLLVRRAYVLGRDQVDQTHYDEHRVLAWHEPRESYADSPSTKAEQCLRDVFGIAPREALCRYEIGVDAARLEAARDYLAEICGVDATAARFPAVLVHYQGHSFAPWKNIDERVIRECIGVIVSAGLTPVILDWEGRSRLLELPCVRHLRLGNRLWNGQSQGDGATLATLARLSMLSIGIDSGPGHIYAATETPAIIVWRKLHPINYFGLASNVTHVVPRDHERWIKGDRRRGADYFRRRYQHRVYHDLRVMLPRLVAEFCEAARGRRAELIVERDLWVRDKYRHSDCGVIGDVIERDCYHLATLPRRPRYVLDIGAQIGAYGAAVHHRYPQARIACVEPDPRSRAALARNVGSFAHVVASAVDYRGGEKRLLAAVSPKHGTECTMLADIEHNGRLVRAKRPDGIEYEAMDTAVRCETLEEIVGRLGWPRVDLMKLDCEGCEQSVLAHSALAQDVAMIVGEYHGRAEFLDVVRRRFADWELRMFSEAEDGVFWLMGPTLRVRTAGINAAARQRNGDRAPHGLVMRTRS